MAFSQDYAAVALTAVIGKLSYGWVKHWWTKKSLAEKYISAAMEQQCEIETVGEEHNLDADLELSVDGPPAKRVVRHRGVFRNFLVRSGQAKFGCPARNEANRLVVRKYLHDLCVEHGLLARHIADHVDIATELVFIPSRQQLTAAAIRHTELSKLRHGVMTDLRGQLPTVA